MATRKHSKPTLAAVAASEDAGYLRCKKAQELLFAIQRKLRVANAIMDVAQALTDPVEGEHPRIIGVDSPNVLLAYGCELLDAADDEAMELYTEYVRADEETHPMVANG